MNLIKYKTIVFDCDGVILNSNKLKTEAFYRIALPYGEANAACLVEYHLKNGGVSRNAKFKFFLREVLKRPYTNCELDQLLVAYSHEVRKGLMRCELSSGMDRLRKLTSNIRWMLVSGGNQQELRSVFTDRKLDHYFDGGIYGSPENKEAIFNREIEGLNLKLPAVYIGDSVYDYKAASKFGLDFIFASKWTEFHDYLNYCEKRNILMIPNIGELTSIAN
jgi:phosphoglycolate phosphatase-like HAD superfamily hydrolase